MMYSSYNFPQWLKISLVASSPISGAISWAFCISSHFHSVWNWSNSRSPQQASQYIHILVFLYGIHTSTRVLAWTTYLLSKCALVTDTAIQLGCCLICAILLSFILCIKNCFMSHWLMGNPESNTSMCCQSQSSQCNPYSLIILSCHQICTY